jgi:hypothetical protein
LDPARRAEAVLGDDPVRGVWIEGLPSVATVAIERNRLNDTEEHLEQVMRIVEAGQRPPLEVLARTHPLRHLRLVPVAGAGLQLARGHQEQQCTKHEPQHPHPRRRITAVARVGRAGDAQHDELHDGETDEPAEDERRAVHPGPTTDEHQDHGDDRHRAEGHADAERAARHRSPHPHAPAPTRRSFEPCACGSAPARSITATRRGS